MKSSREFLLHNLHKVKYLLNCQFLVLRQGDMSLRGETERAQLDKCPQKSFQVKFLREEAEWKRTGNCCEWSDRGDGKVMES